MSPLVPAAPSENAMSEVNRRFYDPLWERSRVVEAHRFNTWPLVQSLLAPSQARLEVAPGLRPRFPLEGTRFIDMSAPAVEKLRARGADAAIGHLSSLPAADGAFELIGAFDIVEHVEDDDAALRELARVAAPGATLVLSAPLHPSRWTSFDDLVGHRRRYEADEILAKLAQSGFTVEQSALFGMQPRSSRLLDYGVWQLQNRPDRAMWWYDRVALPIIAFFQKKLTLQPGMMDVRNVDEVLLVCRRAGGPPSPSA